MKGKVLALLRNGQKPISGEEISAQLGVSRTAVWKHIQALKEEGYEIISQPGTGYLLKGVPDRLLPEELSQFLVDSIFGKNIVYHRTVRSTNDEAKTLADEGAPEGTLVIAERQEQGKGRLGRHWFSPEGAGIYVTAVLRPPLKPEEASGFTLLAAVALVQTIQQVSGLAAGIKWPNDVLLENKKMAGILTEMKAETDRIHYMVIGTGINVNTEQELFPEELRNNATSIRAVLGEEVSRIQLLISYLKSLETLYDIYLKQGLSPIIKAWKKRNVTLSQYVSVTSGLEVFHGRAVDITDSGGLVVLGEDGKQKIFQSGEVTLRDN